MGRRARAANGDIYSVAGEQPHKALLAAMIRRALMDARIGSQEARDWLAGTVCLYLLSYLVPGKGEPEAVQARLLEESRVPLREDGEEAA